MVRKSKKNSKQISSKTNKSSGSTNFLSTTNTKTKIGISFSKSFLSLFSAFIAGVILVIGYMNLNKHTVEVGMNHSDTTNTNIDIDVLDNPSPPPQGILGRITGMFMKPSSGYTNNPKDLLFNPNAPPLKENVYLTSTGPEISNGSLDIRGDIHVGSGHQGRRAPIFNQPHRMSINQSTQHMDREYLQVGFLKRSNPISRQTTESRRPDPLETSILPIFGRPLQTHRQKWQYYTMTNSNNMVKLPIVNKGKVCTNEYGCDELFNAETVYVQGIDDQYTVNIYENEQPRYIPSL